MELINLREVQRLVPRSKASIYKAIQNRLFPKPIKVGASAYWQRSEIEKLVAAYVSGASDGAVRELVIALHADRVSS